MKRSPRPTHLFHDELYEFLRTPRECRRAVRRRIACWDEHRVIWRLTRHARLMRWIKGWI